MNNIDEKRKELEEFKDFVKKRIDHDIFVPREMVTLDGKDLYKLFDIFDDYGELLDLFINERELLRNKIYIIKECLMALYGASNKYTVIYPVQAILHEIEELEETLQEDAK